MDRDERRDAVVFILLRVLIMLLAAGSLLAVAWFSAPRIPLS